MAEKLSAKSAWKLNNALKKSAATKPTKVGTARVTRRDSDGSVWVRLPGSNVDTPVNGQILSDAQVGDTVSVRIENGRLSLMGNASTPSVGQQQVNTTVQPVQQTADNALETASTAQTAAELATSYAAAAQVDAKRAKDAADDAQGSADIAQASANTAASAAQSALLGLSTVEDVVDTLTWITKHGTMTLTTDTTVDPSKVYFIPDASGQYVVGGSSYSIVQNPTVEGLSGYYELTIDKSVENYIATHVSVTDEGLWLTPTSSNGYRVLIATGAGTAYTTAGTYIIDNTGNIRAVIGETIRLGGTGESRAIIDYHSLQLVDRDGYPYLDISELQDRDGNVTERFKNVLTPIAPLTVDVSFDVETLVRVTVDSEDVTSSATFSGTTVSVPMEGGPLEVVVVYKPYFHEHYYYANYIKAYTLGVRKDGQVGGMSTVLGYGNLASGLYSHAEGAATESRGVASHAEGYGPVASGDYSHAQNHDTIASSEAQTAMGRYNANDPAHALEVGNGTSDNARSNALAVGWDGTTDLGPMPLSDSASGVHVHGSNVSTTDETASASVYGLLVGGYDKGGNLRSYLKHTDIGNGRQGVQLETRRLVNGSNVYNGLQMHVAADGTRTVSLSDRDAWLSALGYTAPTALPLASGCVAYSSGQTPTYSRDGHVVSVWGAVKPTSQVAAGGTLDIGTLPAGYRPSHDVAALCQGSGQNKWLLTISSSGAVNAARYSSGATSIAMPANTWLPFCATFITTS